MPTREHVHRLGLPAILRSATSEYLPKPTSSPTPSHLHRPFHFSLDRVQVLIKHSARLSIPPCRGHTTVFLAPGAFICVMGTMILSQSRMLLSSGTSLPYTRSNSPLILLGSMGTAWTKSLSYSWEHGYYMRGIKTVKVNIMLCIYSD